MCADKVKGFCPKCRQELEIPAGLMEFSCLYCGEKLTLQELLPRLPGEDTDRERLLDTYRAGLPGLFSDYLRLRGQFTRKDYAPAFQGCLDRVQPLMLALDEALLQQPSTRKQQLTQAAAQMLEAAQAQMESQSGWKRRSARNGIIFDVKLTIALFLTPAIQETSATIAPAFAAELHRQWMEKYPDCPYTPATYAEISAGFRKRKFCFITTAICRSEGKPDDCPELTAFRAFRDGWLSRQPDGQALIREYYDIAPAMVMTMDYCESPQIYAHLRRDYLDPCYQALTAGRMEQCKALYVSMVQALKERYGQ